MSLVDVVSAAPEPAERVDFAPPLRSATERLSRADREAPIVRFARKVLRFELWSRQAEILAAIYRTPARIFVLRLGRRSGKGRMAAAIAVYEATANAAAHLAGVIEGEQIVIAVIANSAEQARVLYRYARGFLKRSPELERMIVRDTADEIELDNGIVITVLSTSGRSIRGRAVAVAILDEFAHALDGDGRLLSPQAASEILEAVVPATAQFPSGKVIVTSTPRWATGEFYRLCEQAATGLVPDIVEFHAATQEVNPRIREAFLRAEEIRDPAAYRREYLALFDSGIGALFDEETIRAAIAPRGDLAPVPGRSYVISIDPAYTHDAFALVCAHGDGRRLVVDMVRSWRGTRGRPVSHRTVLDDVAAIAAAYNRASIITDQFADVAIVSGLQERGLHADSIAWTNESKLEAAQALRQLLYAGDIELSDDAALAAELMSLEQRPTPSGKPRIAAPPGSRDDLATALMAIALMWAQPEPIDEVLYFDPETGLYTSEMPELRQISPV